MVKELNCKASLVQERMPEDSSEYSYRRLVAHNHPPNPLTLQSSRFMKELEEEIKFFSGSTKELFDKVIER